MHSYLQLRMARLTLSRAYQVGERHGAYAEYFATSAFAQLLYFISAYFASVFYCIFYAPICIRLLTYYYALDNRLVILFEREQVAVVRSCLVHRQRITLIGLIDVIHLYFLYRIVDYLGNRVGV